MEKKKNQLVFRPIFDFEPGNALERVQREHAPADFWDITFCTR
jgi:hypothetical protein